MADDDNAAKKNKGKAIITEQHSDSADDSSNLKLSTESSDEDVQSKDGGGDLLDSISDLEKSLPIKRGLSSHYDGKSRSFGSLVDLSIDSVQELEKKEHVLNKKRKLIIANEEYGKKQPVEDTDDSSSKVEIHGPIDSNRNEDDKEKDDNTKNEEDEDKSKN